MRWNNLSSSSYFICLCQWHVHVDMTFPVCRLQLWWFLSEIMVLSQCHLLCVSIKSSNKVIKLPGHQQHQVVGLVGHLVLTAYLTPLTRNYLDALTWGVNVQNVQVGLSGTSMGCIGIGPKNVLIQLLIKLTADLALRPSSFCSSCTVITYNH